MGTDRKNEPERRLRVALLSLAFLAVIAYPAHRNWADAPEDDFPLSHMPMGSDYLRDDVVVVTHLFDVDYEGSRHIIPYEAVAPGGYRQLHRQMAGLRANAGGAKILCEHVAHQILTTQPGIEKRVVEIQVVRGVYLLVPYTQGRIEARDEQVLSRCPLIAPPEQG